MRRHLSALLAVVMAAGGLSAAESVEIVEDRDPLPPGQPSAALAPVDDTGSDGSGDDAEADDDDPAPPPVATDESGDDVTPASTGPDHRAVILQQAEDLAATGRRARAIALLEDLADVLGDDKAVRTRLLELRIAERKDEMRAIVAAAADDKEFVLGAPAYEEAKARAPTYIARQLDMVEYLVQDQRFTQAVELCQRILEEHAGEDATMILLDRLLEHLVRLERRRLERDRAVRRGEVVNDVIERGTMPREPAPMPRTVLVFDEDLAEVERERLLQQLQIEVGLMSYREQPLRSILQDLFALAGLNYVIRDDALGEETLTISLVDESVEHVLEVIQRMVPVQFNYRGGSVYVTSADSPILVTEIIRLQAGLTDVLSQASLAGGGGEDGGAPPIPPLGGGGGGEASSDVERFLETALAGDGLVTWPEGSSWYLDRKSNSLYVRSSPAAIAEVKRLLHALDYNNVQVLIEARFVQVSTEAVDQLGVNWALLGQEDGRGDATYLFGGAQGSPLNPLGAGAAQLGANLTQGQSGLRIGALGVGEDVLPNFSVTLNALEERGDANIFSEPKILALNNSLGVISFTNDIGYQSGFENVSVGNNNVNINDDTVVNSSQNVLVPTFEVEQEQIELQVRPSVARNSDIITLFVQPRIREFTGFADGGDFSNVGEGTTVLGNLSPRQPLFRERQLVTTLHVQNGQTIVLGGLVEEDDQNSRDGLPYLSRIPALGNLFGRKSQSLRRSKLLIFVTTHIIDPSGSKFTEEVRHLRDTARVTLTAEARAREAAREALEAELAAERAAERAERAEGDAEPNRGSRRGFGGRRRR